MPIATRAFAATAADKPLVPYSFERRDPGPDDVLIDIKYCGYLQGQQQQTSTHHLNSMNPALEVYIYWQPQCLSQ